MRRDLVAVASECMAEQDMLGIPYGKVTEWKVNTRALTRWGQCAKHPNGTYTIDINADLLNCENSISCLKDTIHHELLHTVDGCMNHGTKWKALAKRLNDAYGYNISRVSSASCKGVAHTRKPKYKYEIICPNCGVIGHRMKKSDAISNIKDYRCHMCKSGNLRIKTL